MDKIEVGYFIVLFEKEIAGAPAVSVAYTIETNAVFLNMPKILYQKLQDMASFYWWNEQKSEARFIFSFNNTADEVKRFAQKLLELS